MVKELDALENKVALAAALCRDLRAENVELKKQLAVAENERKIMSERMASARARLEMLAEQLPSAKTPA